MSAESAQYAALADPAQYAALAERAGFADRSACGRLRVAGADALDLLNRLTTNDLSSLPDGTARSTVLTNGDARVIDHLRLAASGGAVWCVTSPGRADAVVEWIDRYTFGEDIAVEDVSSATAQFTVAGPLAGDALGAAGLPVPALNEVGFQDGAVVVASAFGAHPVYDVILPLTDAGHMAAALRANAAEADAAAFDAYRIAQGVPAYGAEFGEFNNPLEARLLGSISDDKGCYTGQEVIARLQTYRKTRRSLMAFDATAPAAPGDALADAGGSPAGVVTSAREVGGRAFGLALVAVKFAEAGAALRLPSGGEATLSESLYAAATESGAASIAESAR